MNRYAFTNFLLCKNCSNNAADGILCLKCHSIYESLRVRAEKRGCVLTVEEHCRIHKQATMQLELAGWGQLLRDMKSE